MIQKIIFFIVSIIVFYYLLVLTIKSLVILKRIYSFKKDLIKRGYSKKNMSRFISTSKFKFKNLKDAIKYNIFSFKFLLISNFGKDVIEFVKDNKVRHTYKMLKRIHKSYYKTLRRTILVFGWLLFFSFVF